ncbi:MAG: hypothetical protein J6O90_06655 [Candidatus Methanomethylophilaceae archaeon]|nr:hypothetical protein [Candidatus Methanomethylophilaceae archaeon]
MDPSRVEKQSTVKSGILLIVLFVLIVAAAVAVAMNPDILENIAVVIVLIVLGLAAIAVVIAIFAGLLAIPMYMKKGVEVQTDYSYSLDDVKEVDGSMENKKE